MAECELAPKGLGEGEGREGNEEEWEGSEGEDPRAARIRERAKGIRTRRRQP